MNYVLMLVIIIILAYFYKVTLQRAGSNIIGTVSRNLPSLDFLYF